jgi:hypothetical protein
VERVAALTSAGAWTIYAWALVENHAHLLVRTGTRPRARSMRYSRPSRALSSRSKKWMGYMYGGLLERVA